MRKKNRYDNHIFWMLMKFITINDFSWFVYLFFVFGFLSILKVIIFYMSSFKSRLTLLKSKSSPVPRRNMSNTSEQVVSKCDVASNDVEMKT